MKECQAALVVLVICGVLPFKIAQNVLLDITLQLVLAHAVNVLLENSLLLVQGHVANVLQDNIRQLLVQKLVVFALITFTLQSMAQSIVLVALLKLALLQDTHTVNVLLALFGKTELALYALLENTLSLILPNASLALMEQHQVQIAQNVQDAQLVALFRTMSAHNVVPDSTLQKLTQLNVLFALLDQHQA